jgi:uncharacterized membrane protein
MTAEEKGTPRLRIDRRLSMFASLVFGLVVLAGGFLLARKTATNDNASLVAWLMIALGIVALMAAFAIWAGAYDRDA